MRCNVDAFLIASGPRWRLVLLGSSEENCEINNKLSFSIIYIYIQIYWGVIVTRIPNRYFLYH